MVIERLRAIFGGRETPPYKSQEWYEEQIRIIEARKKGSNALVEKRQELRKKAQLKDQLEAIELLAETDSPLALGYLDQLYKLNVSSGSYFKGPRWRSHLRIEYLWEKYEYPQARGELRRALDFTIQLPQNYIPNPFASQEAIHLGMPTHRKIQNAITKLKAKLQPSETLNDQLRQDIPKVLAENEKRTLWVEENLRPLIQKGNEQLLKGRGTIKNLDSGFPYSGHVVKVTDTERTLIWDAKPPGEGGYEVDYYQIQVGRKWEWKGGNEVNIYGRSDYGRESVSLEEEGWQEKAYEAIKRLLENPESCHVQSELSELSGKSSWDNWQY